MDEIKAAEFEALLAKHGIVRKEKVVEVLNPEDRAARIAELVAMKDAALKAGDEPLAKKLRRILRKKYDFKVSEHTRVVIE